MLSTPSDFWGTSRLTGESRGAPGASANGEGPCMGADRGGGGRRLLQGSALNAVDAKGRLSVPAFVRGVIERRSDARAIVVGAHEIAPCLTAYGRNYAKNLWSDLERRRLAEEDAAGRSTIIMPAPGACSA